MFTKKKKKVLFALLQPHKKLNQLLKEKKTANLEVSHSNGSHRDSHLKSLFSVIWSIFRIALGMKYVIRQLSNIKFVMYSASVVLHIHVYY